MKFSLIALTAIIATQAINLSDAPPTLGDVPAPDEDPTYKKVTSDPTGTYSPKANMWTGFEGSKNGNEQTFTYRSTGEHPSLNRVPSTTSNHRNAVNEGSSHQRPN